MVLDMLIININNSAEILKFIKKGDNRAGKYYTHIMGISLYLSIAACFKAAKD